MKMPCCCVLSTVCPAGMGDAMAIHYEADAWTGIVGGKGLVTQFVQLEAKPMDSTHCNSKGCALPCVEFLWVINMMSRRMMACAQNVGADQLWTGTCMNGACAGQTKEGLGPELCSVRVLVSGLVRESRALSDHNAYG